MFVQVHTPETLTGQQLDSYLELGWFRMGQTIFTTNFAHVNDQMLSTIWLRVLLLEYEQDTAHKKLLKQNAKFTTRIQPAIICEEKENLYSKYRQSLRFTVSDSLHHLLFGKNEFSIYTTFEVTVYDQQKLIGCGFFDVGSNSAEGIVSFYDPEYKKFSLGRFLIYAKIQFCKELGLDFFYPGYFVPGNPYFDYKLTIAKQKLEYLNLSTNNWKHISSFTNDAIPINAMQNKLAALQNCLQEVGLECHVLKYEFFDAGLIPDMRDSGLLDFPVFLLMGPLTEEPAGVIIVYDVRDEAFHLQVCMPVWKPDRTNPDQAFYSAYFLKPVQEVFATHDVQIMAALLKKLAQQAVDRH